ncbi:MAG: Mov34/MPN/PAD-1 family protein [Anaerolineae bacterium]|nr:Mov34/MPN/PAD-1 family protein [Anaerolineae bacterium]
MNNLVTYHLHQTPLLPPSDAHFYQYVIAQNGVFVRAENEFVSACLPVTHLKEATAPIRGLQPLGGWVRLKIPQIPLNLLETAIADAQVSAENGRLDETLSYVVWSNGRVGELTSSRYRLIKPADQKASPNFVVTEMVEPDETVVMDIHSHGAAPPYFSPTDDQDETRLRFYGVIGNLRGTSQWRFRLGIYGHWAEIDKDTLFACDITFPGGGYDHEPI